MRLVTLRGNHWDNYIVTNIGKIYVDNGYYYKNIGGYWLLEFDGTLYSIIKYINPG